MVKNSRILITGGAGTLGSNVVEHLLPKGIEILVVENFATGNRKSLPRVFDNLTVVEGSIADARLVDKLVSEFKPSHIVHSAAAYEGPRELVRRHRDKHTRFY